MIQIDGERKGFALAAAVMALVLVGALVTGGFMAATQENRITQSGHFASEAFNIAEHGLHSVLGSWSLGDFESIPVNDTRSTTLPVSINQQTVGRAVVQVRRLGARLYFIQSTGEVLRGGSGARRTLAMFARTNNFGLGADQAVRVLGKLVIGGSSDVVGIDSVPAGWDESDCPTRENAAGIVAGDTSLIVRRGNGSTIVGDPPKLEDSTMDPGSFMTFGDWDFQDLAARASKVIPAGASVGNTVPTTTADGRCDTANHLNWGDPKNADGACHYYFPIIYAQGDLALSQGYGQGILLVDGDLKINGAYEFNGIVIVRGTVETGNGNANIKGTMLIFNNGNASAESNLGNTTSESTITGNPIINLSSCAIDRAVRYNDDVSRAFPVNERSWIDLTAAGVEG